MKLKTIIFTAMVALVSCAPRTQQRVEQLTAIEVATLANEFQPTGAGLLLTFTTQSRAYNATIFTGPDGMTEYRELVLDTFKRGQSVAAGGKAPCLVLHTIHFLRADGTDSGQEAHAVFYPNRNDRPSLKSTSFSNERFPHIFASGPLNAQPPEKSSSQRITRIELNLPCIIEDEFERSGSKIGGP